jgi:hypothetical protein
MTARWLLLATFALSLYGAGQVWLVQLSSYPLGPMSDATNSAPITALGGEASGAWCWVQRPWSPSVRSLRCGERRITGMFRARHRAVPEVPAWALWAWGPLGGPKGQKARPAQLGARDEAPRSIPSGNPSQLLLLLSYCYQRAFCSRS